MLCLYILHLSYFEFEIDLNQFLSTASWTSHTERIVVDLIYLQSTVRPQALSWIEENVDTCPVEHLSGVLLALVDSAESPKDLVRQDDRYLLTACSRMFKAVKGHTPWLTARTSASCIRLIAQNIPSLRAGLLEMVLRECRALKQGSVNLVIIDVTSILYSCCSHPADELVRVILDHAWTWAVDTFSQNEVSLETYKILKSLGTFLLPFSYVL